MILGQAPREIATTMSLFEVSALLERHLDHERHRLTGASVSRHLAAASIHSREGHSAFKRFLDSLKPPRRSQNGPRDPSKWQRAMKRAGL